MSTSRTRKVETHVESRRGRPKSPETRKKILQAAYELLEQEGFINLTIEGVAARAEVGKPTIYRRWKSKTALAMDAFLETMTLEIGFPDTGSLKDDFREQMQKIVKLLNSSRGKVLANIIGCGQADCDIIAVYQENLLIPRRNNAKRILQRGVVRGEVKESVNAEIVIDTLYGPLFYRLLLKHQPLTAKFVNELVELVMKSVLSG